MRFIWPVRVYYEDTDSGGVVYYANYLRYMERARSEWLRAAGVEQDVLARESGLLFMVRSASLDYRHPARFNEMLEVRSHIVRAKRVSLQFEQSVSAAGRELCRGLITVACVSTAGLRPRRIPPELYRGLLAAAGPDRREGSG